MHGSFNVKTVLFLLWHVCWVYLVLSQKWYFVQCFRKSRCMCLTTHFSRKQLIVKALSQIFLKVGLLIFKKVGFICFKGRLLRTMKNAFYFMLKVVFVLNVAKTFSNSSHVGKRLDKKTNCKVFDVIDWGTNNCNIHIVQYLKKERQPDN